MGINGISQSQTNQCYLLSNNKKQYMDNETLFNTNTTVQDTFTSSTQDGADDGKISFQSKVKNFGKGLISPITSMFSSVENFVLGAGMIIGGAALIAVTGGAAAPLLVAAGVATGAVQFVSGAYKASTAKTDAEAESAWQGIGAGTSITALSVLGAKSSLKAAGKDTTGTGYLKSTVKCFEEIPSSISKSITNGKNFFTAKPAGTKPVSGTKSQNTTANEEPVSHNQKPAQKENGSTVSNTETKPQTTPKTEQPAVQTQKASEPQASISEPKPTAQEQPVTSKPAAEPKVTQQEQSAAPKETVAKVNESTSNVQERTLKNGKKVVKTVTKNPDGTETVKTEIFDKNGELSQTRTKSISRSVNKANGKKYVTIKKDGTDFDPECGKESTTTITDRYYDKDGSRLLETRKMSVPSGGVLKLSSLYDGAGVKVSKQNSTGFDPWGIRRERTRLTNGTDYTTEFGCTGTPVKKPAVSEPIVQEQPAAPKPAAEQQGTVQEQNTAVKPNTAESVPQKQVRKPNETEMSLGITDTDAPYLGKCNMDGLNSYYRTALEDKQLALETGNSTMLESVNKTLAILKPIIEKLDSEYAQLEPSKRVAIKFRGVNNNKGLRGDAAKLFAIIDDAKPGDIIKPDEGYTYVANEAYANAFAYKAPGVRTCLYEIRLPKGTRIFGNTILPRAAQYKVISKEVDGLHTNLKLEYILPSE